MWLSPRRMARRRDVISTALSSVMGIPHNESGMRESLVVLWLLALFFGTDAIAQQGFDCTGLVSGATSPGRTPQSRPSYNAPFSDPLYNTTTTRVTGDAGSSLPPPWNSQNWGTTNSYVAHHYYSEHPAWSADDQYIWLAFHGTGGLLIERKGANDYTVANPNRSAGAMGFVSIPHWDPTEPDTFVGIRNAGNLNLVGKYNVETNTMTTVMTVPGYHNLRISEARNGSSYDGSKIAFLGVRDSDNQAVCVGVDIDAQTVDIEVDLNALGYSPADDDGAWCNNFKYCTCRVSAKGEHLIAFTNASNSLHPGDFRNNAYFFRWSDGQNLGRIPANGNEECPGHWDTGVNQANEDIIFGKCNADLSAEIPPGMQGNMVTVRLSDRQYTAVGPNIGGHSTCKNAGRRGWCFQSTFDSVNANIRAYKLDGSRIEHIANAYNASPTNYWAQTQASVSPSGTKVVWASDWDTGTPAHIYVTEFQDACDSSLAPPTLLE